MVKKLEREEPNEDKETLHRQHAEVMAKIYQIETFRGRMKDKDIEEMSLRLWDEVRRLRAKLK